MDDNEITKTSIDDSLDVTEKTNNGNNNIEDDESELTDEQLYN